MYRALIYFITENETGKSSQAVFYMVTSQNVFLSLELTSMQALCDCQQVRFQRANILNLFLLRLIVVAKGTNNYKLLRSKGNMKTQKKKQRKYNRTWKDTYKRCMTYEHEGLKS